MSSFSKDFIEVESTNDADQRRRRNVFNVSWLPEVKSERGMLRQESTLDSRVLDLGPLTKEWLLVCSHAVSS